MRHRVPPGSERAVARKVLAVHWLWYEQTKLQAVLLDFKMVSYITANIAISYVTVKNVLDATRLDLA